VASSGVTVNVLVVRAIDAEHKREREPSPRNASSTTPEEIADALLFLASDGAAAVNGARIPLFGRG
jgi:NAD(P)-dependent dehydrogenase (short-subunit alcohol dehydrogenase family)